MPLDLELVLYIYMKIIWDYIMLYMFKVNIIVVLKPSTAVGALTGV
jgi:hypothetical protein